MPDEINYQSILQRENDAMIRLLSSAAEFGVVRIIGHGISSEDIRTLLIENELLFRLSEKYANYDKFLWDWSDDAMVQKAKFALGDANFLIFREKLEEVLKKLKGIAKEVDEIIRLSDNEQCWKKIDSEEAKMYIYRCTRNQSSNVDQTWLPPHNATLEDSLKYALHLFLPLEPIEFSMHSKRGRLPFNTTPDTIIVTIGDQLEEWSDGKFRSADGEVALKPNLHIDQTLLSLELKWSFTNLNKNEKIITLSDQFPSYSYFSQEDI
uniref:Non-haem dioxygenase N-terminal domain-containing protein n=1 Tax=Solanum lycopersicum TaxID=4081 RepID=A0A3Q7IW12_SOLLC